MPTTPRAGITYPANTVQPSSFPHRDMVLGIDTQMIARFATTAARDAAITSPIAGQMAYTSTEDKFWIYRTGGWVQQNYARIVLKDNNTARTLTAPGAATADPDLQFPVKANKTYICEFLLIHSGDPAVDISLGWTGPAGVTGMLFILGPAANITDGSVANAYFTSHNAPIGIGAGFTLGCDSTGIATVTKGKLLVSTAATAGTLAFIWSQSTSSAIATTMLANSYLKITEIN